MMNVVNIGGVGGGGGGGASSSEYSSGCESGWTLYLEHSNNSFGTNNNNYNHFHKQKNMLVFHEQHGTKKDGLFFNQGIHQQEDDDDDDEDLSMVSDASSGPPHFDHHDNVDEDEDDNDNEEEEIFCYATTKNTNSMKLSSSNHHHQYFNAQDFTLDDTASSHIFTSKKVKENKGSKSLNRMIDYSSQGFSTNTHFCQGRSTNNFQEHYDFIQPPLSTKQFRQNQWS